MLSSLDAELLLGLTFLAFQSKYDLSCGLGLLVKYRLGLSTETHLLRIVTALSLGEVGSLASLVLGHLVQGVLLALTRAVCLTLLWNIHHDDLFKYIWEVQKEARRHEI
jgi:hypothetical protein